MKKALRRPFYTTASLAIASVLIGSYSNPSVIHNWFGGKKSDSKANEKSKDGGKLNTKSYIWGNGFYQGKADTPVTFRNFEPKLIKTFLGANNINMRDINFGEFHEAGIDLNGNVYVWKKHRLDSSVENQDDIRSDLLLLDNGKNNKYITFSRGFLWLLKDNGDVYQYTINQKIGQTVSKSEEVEIAKAPRKIQELRDITQISTGEDHFAALDRNGNIWVMGDDTFGQCGTGAQNRNSGPPYFEKRIKKPVKLESLKNIDKVVCGGNHTLALTKDGIVYGWGSNSNLQLSHQEEYAKVENPLMAVYTPLKFDKGLERTISTDIAAGREFSIIVGKNKQNDETEVFGCGKNTNGQIAGENLIQLHDIQKIESLSNYTIKTAEGNKNVRIEQIVCGKNHCLAKLSVGAIIEWGANEQGQLGNRRRVFSENPIIIKTFAEENVLKISCREDNSAVICEDN